MKKDKSKQKKEKVVAKVEEYREETPKLSIGNRVLFFTDASIDIEKGEVIGVFTIPGQIEKKEYTYQIEHEYKDSKNKKKKGMCVPRSENIVIDDGEISSSFKNKFSKLRIKNLNDKIAENKNNLKMLGEQMKQDKKFEVEVKKIITNLENIKKEISKK